MYNLETIVQVEEMQAHKKSGLMSAASKATPEAQQLVSMKLLQYIYWLLKLFYTDAIVVYDSAAKIPAESDMEP